MCTEYDPLTNDCVYCGMPESLYYGNHMHSNVIIDSINDFESIDRLIGSPNLTKWQRLKAWVFGLGKKKSRYQDEVIWTRGELKELDKDPIQGRIRDLK